MTALLYKRLLQLGKVAGALTFLFGIPYGIWQYVETIHNQRVQESLRLFDKFNSAPFTDYRAKINDAMATHRMEIEAAAKAGEQQLTTVILQVIAKEKIESAIWLTLDFFDGVSVCVTQNLCDFVTVDKLFSSRAQELYIELYQYVHVQRIGPTSATFGWGLERIATAQHAKS